MKKEGEMNVGRERTEMVFVEEDRLIFIHFKGKALFEAWVVFILFFVRETGGRSRSIDADQEHVCMFCLYLSLYLCLCASLCVYVY